MTAFTLPTTRRVTQPWAAEFDDWDGDGKTDYPGGFYHSIGWDGHNGIDYGCYEGDEVRAVADGVVVWAGWAGDHWLLSGGGICVLIEHRDYGVQTEYLHLSRTDLNVGDRVSKGQKIGLSGSTGASTAPHLHLGMLPISGINLNNRMRGRIDPTPYLYGGASMAPAGTVTESIQEDELSAEFERDVRAQLAKDAQDFGKFDRDVRAQLQSLPSFDRDVRADLAAKGRQITALSSTVEALAGVIGQEQGIDLEQIKQAVTEAIAAGLTITVEAGK